MVHRCSKYLFNIFSFIYLSRGIWSESCFFNFLYLCLEGQVDYSELYVTVCILA